ncbi:hypothetical protein BT63DRAFT_427687 [Microthyrium microscopicum]|uniref:lytic cellulose monooxygenase (C4-dehydrogenating) n=1 Tax=Microthyrium microscopicum TaxID=703497 RepID=A0A6A6U1A7_9PEZI|nr:hypothetical protein BT63DRAFT_427687 [Microthyrium microscopicum]
MWGYQNAKTNGTSPVENVASPDIACRFGPLISPALTAETRAGSTMKFQWTAWFENHRGPVLTYMAYMPSDDVSVNDVDFFKIDQATYDAKTDAFGSDMLIAANNSWTVTIPSDIKPGTYIVRHEIIGLHHAWVEYPEKKISGAQPYPNCIKVKVTGTGTASPPGEKFPGAYNWRDPGLLVNIHYGPKRYIAPGPFVYKGERNPPQGPVPVVTETGAMTGERAERYAKLKMEKGQRLLASVANDLKTGKVGGGGCHWEENADPSTVKCTTINPNNPGYVGYAQPVGTPMYTDKPGSMMKGLKPPPKLYGNEDRPRR